MILGGMRKQTADLRASDSSVDQSPTVTLRDRQIARTGVSGGSEPWSTCLDEARDARTTPLRRIGLYNRAIDAINHERAYGDGSRRDEELRLMVTLVRAERDAGEWP